MKLVKVNRIFYDMCVANGVDQEIMMNKNGRPCVLIVHLTFRGIVRDFVVPLRSNISPITPSWQYCSLPPDKHTKPKFRHGIHYIKLFPILPKYIDKYHVNGDKFYATLQKVINRKEKEIIDSCQEYLTRYEQGDKHSMTPDIDGIISKVLDI